MNRFKLTFNVQCFYGLLVIAWNALGVYRASQDLEPFGPVASMSVVAAATAVIVIFYLLLKQRWFNIYLIFSTAIALMALSRVYAGIIGDPSLWPSPIFQWLGIAINFIGASVLYCLYRDSSAK